MKPMPKILLSGVLLWLAAPGADGQVQAGVRTMRKVEKIFNEDVPVYDDAPRRSPRGGAAPTPNSPSPTNWVVPGAKPVNYAKLELKIISGVPSKRIATINNQSFLAGESLKVT